MEQKQTLYIPQGLKTRSELFDGYGKEELYQTIIIAIIAGIIDILIYTFTKNTAICVVFFLSSIAGAVMMLTKEITNISVVDQVKFMIRFARSQKVYKYKYYDEWRYHK